MATNPYSLGKPTSLGCHFALEAVGFRRRVSLKLSNFDQGKVLGGFKPLATKVETSRFTFPVRVGGALKRDSLSLDSSCLHEKETSLLTTYWSKST